MGAPNPDITALVSELALQYWTVANTPDLTAVVAAVTSQLSRLGGEINSAVIAYAQAQVTAVFTAEEATEEAHGGLVVTPSSSVTFSGAKYQSATAQSVPGAGATTIINYNLRVFDTDNAVTTGAAWHYTALVTGKYLVCAMAAVTDSTAAKLIAAFRNGVEESILGVSSGAFAFEEWGSTILQLTIGDTLDIRVINFGATQPLSAAPTHNWVSIGLLGS